MRNLILHYSNYQIYHFNLNNLFLNFEYAFLNFIFNSNILIDFTVNF